MEFSDAHGASVIGTHHSAPPEEPVAGPHATTLPDRLSGSEQGLLERLKAEIVALRYDARRYDELKDQLPVWRAKADRYGELLGELRRVPARAALAAVLLRQWWLVPLVMVRSSRPSALAPRPRASNRARHVCIVSDTELRGGARVANMAQTLADAGYAVTVLCRRPPPPPLEDLSQPAQAEYLTPSPCSGGVRHRPPIGTRTRRRSTAGFLPARLLGAASGWVRELPRRIAHDIPSILLLGIAQRRLKAAASHEPSLQDAAKAPSHRWAQTHALAEGADRATHDRRFDLVQAHGSGALLAAARLAARDGAQLLVDAVGLPHRPAVAVGGIELLCQWCEQREEAALFREADISIAAGSAAAEGHAGKYGIDRPIVVRDCRRYWKYQADRRLRSDCALGEAARLVVWCGPACREGEIERLIDAAALMSPALHIAIVVAPPPPRLADFTDRLARHATARGLADRVHYRPAPEPADDLAPYLSGADCGVVLRPNEHGTNFHSMVTARLPVAAAAGGDLADAVRDFDIGEAFDGRGPKNIAATLERMLEPESCRRRRQNAMDLAEHMTWEAERTAYLAIIRALAPIGATADAGTG